ncbi:MAG: UDP-N-acetylglucosamine 2-epimerase (non-hydrolyzing) [Nitrospirae bacterium]|nr:UDP-N-acetylglucosamine 2-epimerase (non-hydrolyzing) [Nitrospirota bacterium]
MKKVLKSTVIHLITAARPNFMKVAPLYHSLIKEQWCRPMMVHTGQHYDVNMSDTFLSDMLLPNPDIYLNVGSGTHAEQTARVMTAYEKVCFQSMPDWVIVVGDVNSTMACAITAKKLCLPVAHLEAGLRSGDRTMPEEINRIVTDTIADLLWTPSHDADANLLREGIAAEKIKRVGNIMIDSYEMMLSVIEKENVPAELGVDKHQYGVLTLHRPSNVDDQEVLRNIVDSLIETSKMLPLIFPVHPRTKNHLKENNLLNKILVSSRINIIEPLGYIKFMSLVKNAKLVITDSGGIQEETTYLNIPCLTLRNTTERPITLTHGTNKLVNTKNIIHYVRKIIEGQWQNTVCPEYWDGKTAFRIVESLKTVIGR